MADTGIAAGTGWPSYLTEVWVCMMRTPVVLMRTNFVPAQVLSGIGIAILISRWIIRLRTVGIKGFSGDDYAIVPVLAFTVMDAATVTVAYYHGQNVDLTADMLPLLTEADIKRLTYGSKVELSAWYSYVTLIWAMKATMLLFYRRLTFGSFHKKSVYYLFWLTGLTYFIAIMVLTFGCFPTYKNWQVTPMAPWKCSFRPQNFIAVATLNITTDVALLAVPVPLLWKLNMPLKKKIVIGGILCTGVLVIVAAIIRVVLSLDAVPSPANINGWGVRETFIAIIAINIPAFKPVFSRNFWALGKYDSSKGSKAAHTVDGATRPRTANATMRTWNDDIEAGREITAGRKGAGSGSVTPDEYEMKPGQILKTAVTVQTTTRDGDEENLISKE